jgi:predicted nucleotidyltransferase
MSQTLPGARDEVVRRFMDACQDDARIQAALIGGSVGSGTADAHADIDLFVVLADDDYDAFFAERDAFLDRLGTPVFRETLNMGFDVLAFIMESGVDGEVLFHRVSEVDDLHTGPFRMVIDRAALLQGRTFPHAYPTGEAVAEELPVVLAWFWRDTLHFTRAIARDRLWTAYGFLEKLRGGCQYLIAQVQAGNVQRSDHFVPFDGYEALDHVGESPELSMLRESLCSLERDVMVRSAGTLVDIYQRLAPLIAEIHGQDYPDEAATVVMRRLGSLTMREG